MNNGLLFLICTTILLSCNQPEKLNEQDYIRWMNSKEGAVQELVTKNFIYVCKYTPIDYLLCIERANGLLNNWDKRASELGSLLYFNFNLNTIENSDINQNESVIKENLKELEEYLRMDAQKDFYLLFKDEKISPAIYHMEGRLNSSMIKLVMGFEVEEKPDKVEFIFNNSKSGESLDFEFKIRDFPLLVQNNI